MLKPRPGQRAGDLRVIGTGQHPRDCAAVLEDLFGGLLSRILVAPAVDVFWDGSVAIELTAERVPGRNTHGTGCTLSAAIAAGLASGLDLAGAARMAKTYVTRAIAQAPGLGHGHGPIQHFPK